MLTFSCLCAFVWIATTSAQGLRGAPPPDIDGLIAQAAADNANPPFCTGYSADNASEITVSPLARVNTTLIQLRKPANFDQTSEVVYKIIQHPLESSSENETVFDINSKHLVYVATDNLSDFVDLIKSYNLPNMAIVVEAESEQFKCLIVFNLRFYDQFLAVEPDWDANPILPSSYKFTLDCTSNVKLPAVIGVIGDPERNEIYSVSYDIANNSSDDGKLFKLNGSSGELSTKSKNFNKNSYQFRVSASAPAQRTKYSNAQVNITGKCDAKSIIENDAEDEEDEFKFVVQKCVHIGDFIGSLPKEFGGKKIISYRVVPAEKEFSVTADGRIRVLDTDHALSTMRNYTGFHVAVTLENGTALDFEFDVEITAKNCGSLDETQTPMFGLILNDSIASNNNFAASSILDDGDLLQYDIEVSCPLPDEHILSLNTFPQLKKRFEKVTNALENATLSTNDTKLIRVTPAMELKWSPELEKSSVSKSDQPSVITISLTATTEASSSSSALAIIRVVIMLDDNQCGVMQPDNDDGDYDFEQYLAVKCLKAGQKIAQVQPASKLNERVQARAHYEMCCSDFYDVDNQSGIVYAKTQPFPEATHDFTTVLKLLVQKSSPESNVIKQQRGRLNIHSYCDIVDEEEDENQQLAKLPLHLTVNENAERVPPEQKIPSIDNNKPAAKLVCETFGEPEDRPLQIGVVARGSSKTNVVAQVFAELPDSPSSQILWSLVDADSGYKVDSKTGILYQTRPTPAARVNVLASLQNDPANSCQLTLQPYAYADDELTRAGSALSINRQPPHLTSLTWNFATRVPRACITDNYATYYILSSGQRLGRVSAVDLDSAQKDGVAAGEVYYSLCTATDTPLPLCGNTLLVELPDADFQTTFIPLTIDINTGDIIVTQWAKVPINAENNTSNISVFVRASNILPLQAALFRWGGESRAETPVVVGVPIDSGDIGELQLTFSCEV